jgi:hypothetical protein
MVLLSDRQLCTTTAIGQYEASAKASLNIFNCGAVSFAQPPDIERDLLHTVLNITPPAKWRIHQSPNFTTNPQNMKP